jgi:hypothetical protein
VVEVNEDEIGGREKKLRRDGDREEVDLGYRLSPGESADALASYQRTDENVAFFDSEGWLTGVGIGVEF